MHRHFIASVGRPVVVVHGGTSSARALDGVCHAAAQIGLDALRSAGEALDGAVAAALALEEDGRFNAGSGAVPAADGHTIEMDAAVMDTRGRLGAVAALRDVRNPVRVARAVADSPHWLIAGEGALRFARAVGLDQPHRVSPRAPVREASAELADSTRLLRFWNFASPPPAGPLRGSGSDTIGAVTRDASGGFAVAASTGGLSGKLLGRVGDTPAIGCGFYAGPAGAFAVTGIGEHIVRAQLAFRAHAWVEAGRSLIEALERAIALFPSGVDVGIVAVSAEGAGVCANRDMAFAIVEA